MNITPDLFEAHLKCPTQCWLRALTEPSAGNEHAGCVKTQSESYPVTATERLQAQTLPADTALSPPAESLKTAKWRLAVEVPACVPHETASDRSADSLVRESPTEIWELANSVVRAPASVAATPFRDRRCGFAQPSA